MQLHGSALDSICYIEASSNCLQSTCYCSPMNDDAQKFRRDRLASLAQKFENNAELGLPSLPTDPPNRAVFFARQVAIAIAQPNSNCYITPIAPAGMRWRTARNTVGLRRCPKREQVRCGIRRTPRLPVESRRPWQQGQNQSALAPQGALIFPTPEPTGRADRSAQGQMGASDSRGAGPRPHLQRTARDSDRAPQPQGAAPSTTERNQ